MTSSDIIDSMRNSALGNYIIPGLTSSFIGGPDKGKVRMFDMEREQFFEITPHSHRYDFTCLVLQGLVANTVWTEVYDDGIGGDDLFRLSELVYNGYPGSYSKNRLRVVPFKATKTQYHKGDWYTMAHDQIHSINFSKGAKVLFFEGPSVSDSSLFIEPYTVNGTVETLRTEDWMFIERF